MLLNVVFHVVGELLFGVFIGAISVCVVDFDILRGFACRVALYAF